MTYSSSVLYPKTPTSTFDMSYYLQTHMPLVTKSWGSLGLQDWSIVEFAPGPDGGMPYSVQAILTWESAEAMQKAMQAEKAPFDDIKNFSNEGPTLVAGEVKATM